MTLDAMKLFHFNRSMFLAELHDIEERLDVEILPHNVQPGSPHDAFFPQFPTSLREAAASMAQHYEAFYCLENYIRDLVVQQLASLHGATWWDEKAPQGVKDNVSFNIKREQDEGVTRRSSDLIDYTTFGELSNIIDANWGDFGDIFNSRRGVARVLGRLNLLRGPIAHCSELSEDEVLRLRLSLRDFFRLMS
jgi:hypothetical protein